MRFLNRMGFDVVHGCQLRCIGCPNSTLNPTIHHISVKDFNTCLSNIDVVSIKCLRFFNFGEAFLHPYLPEIIDASTKHTWTAIEREVSTNAQIFNEEMVEDVLKRDKLTRLVVSCDGNGTPMDYERLRPPAKWDKLILFLTKTKEIKDRTGSSTQLITRNICTTLDGQDRWNKILLKIGWNPQFRDWIALPEASASPWEREAIIPNSICNLFSDDKLYVDYDGTVVPCCAHPCAFKLGNLMNEKFSEILQKKERRNMMLKMRSERESIPICNQCEVKG